MGSLMAGWDSPIHDPKSVKYQRNKSLMKEEIEAYWRSKNSVEKEQLKHNTVIPRTAIESGYGVLQRSNSLPLTDRKGNFLVVDSDTALEKLMKRNDWWTRSDWAFLNEPPVIATEGPTYKYASQYHVTGNGVFGSSKPPDTQPGIRT